MSELIDRGLPCDACGSSDAVADYGDHTYCFSCETYKDTDGSSKQTTKRPKELLPEGNYESLVKRNINEETCRRFGYTVGNDRNGRLCQIAPYYDERGNLVGQKLRYPDKTFSVTGSVKTMFGRQLWRSGGKRIVVTEGEIDAMSYAQATDLKWPVVSIPNGSSSAKKSILQNLEWLETFDNVVLMFDNDEPGRKATLECAPLFTPGKCLLASLPTDTKDANDLLQKRRVKELVDAMWNARPYRPDGIIQGAELWDAVSKPVTMGTPYPWPSWNTMLYGMRPGELVTLTGGTGIGKSTFCAEIAYHLAQTQGVKVGYIALEENVGRSATRFVGLALDKPIHLPGYEVTMEERRAAFDRTLGKGSYFFYDHWGSLDSENLISKIRYLMVGCGCQYVVLDHISIVVSGMDLDGDERRAIDHTMTTLRSLVESTQCGLIIVSHLKRPTNGTGHEEGAQTSLSQLRGSQAIPQLSDIVIGLERNQQDADENDIVTVRCLKNRYSGMTGIVGRLRYDKETGRLSEVTDFDEDDPSPDF